MNQNQILIVKHIFTKIKHSIFFNFVKNNTVNLKHNFSWNNTILNSVPAVLFWTVPVPGGKWISTHSISCTWYGVFDTASKDKIA